MATADTMSPVQADAAMKLIGTLDVQSSPHVRPSENALRVRKQDGNPIGFSNSRRNETGRSPGGPD